MVALCQIVCVRYTICFVHSVIYRNDAMSIWEQQTNEPTYHVRASKKRAKDFDFPLVNFSLFFPFPSPLFFHLFCRQPKCICHLSCFVSKLVRFFLRTMPKILAQWYCLDVYLCCFLFELSFSSASWLLFVPIRIQFASWKLWHYMQFFFWIFVPFLFRMYKFCL